MRSTFPSVRWEATIESGAFPCSAQSARIDHHYRASPITWAAPAMSHAGNHKKSIEILSVANLLLHILKVVDGGHRRGHARRPSHVYWSSLPPACFEFAEIGIVVRRRLRPSFFSANAMSLSKSIVVQSQSGFSKTKERKNGPPTLRFLQFVRSDIKPPGKEFEARLMTVGRSVRAYADLLTPSYSGFDIASLAQPSGNLAFRRRLCTGGRRDRSGTAKDR